MIKYSEQEILKAYDEFNSDKDWVSYNAHERVAYDFLKLNQSISEFMKIRDITSMLLYYCLNSISKADTFDERKQRIMTYCEENDIFFNKYFTLSYIHQLGIEQYVEQPVQEDYRILMSKGETREENYEQVIKGLAGQIRMAASKKARFGIMEYYAYHNIDLLELKYYLDEQDEFKADYEIVRAFIEELELSEQLESVAYVEALIPTSSKRYINDLYVNDEALRESVTQLLITRYPVLTGTLNYACGLQASGKLGTLSKAKIKTKFESKCK